MGKLWNKWGEVIGSTRGADRTDRGEAAANAKVGEAIEHPPALPHSKAIIGHQHNEYHGEPD